jgi:hypothetical protein
MCNDSERRKNMIKKQDNGLFVLVNDKGEKWKQDDKGEFARDGKRQISHVSRKTYSTRKNAEVAEMKLGGK